MALEETRSSPDVKNTPAPAQRGDAKPIFVVQEHHASRLHYDFRLEADGVLKSWAVPKGPSLDPSDKRLAVRVEDHALSCADFAGTIPEGQYGAGEVLLWDRGTYDYLAPGPRGPQTVAAALAAGRVEVVLHGERLRGRFVLVRMQGKQAQKSKQENWLMIKGKDEFARPGDQLVPAKQPAPKAAARKKSPAAPVASAAAAPPDLPALTSPDKLLYPEDGITKRDVYEFYHRIAPHLLPYLRDRPITLERFPDGIGGEHFFQKNAQAHYPAWIPRVELPTERGKPVQYVLVNDLRTLLYLVNQNALTFHVWFSRVGSLDRPDFVLFDLDPGEATFADAVAVARRLHALLKGDGVEAFLKTSGKSGLHVLTPWRRAGDYEVARAWALEVGGRLADAMPDRVTLEIRKAKRAGRLYLDVMQNVRGHHAVAPYVLRPVPGAPVSTPLDWRELKDDLDPKAFTLKTIFRRLARKKQDPLAGLLGAAPAEGDPA